jgi:hypothetical protein
VIRGPFQAVTHRICHPRHFGWFGADARCVEARAITWDSNQDAYSVPDLRKKGRRYTQLTKNRLPWCWYSSFHAKNGLPEYGMVRFLGALAWFSSQWEARANLGDGQKASAVRGLYDIPLYIRDPSRLRYQSRLTQATSAENTQERKDRSLAHFGSLVLRRFADPITSDPDFSLVPRSVTGLVSVFHPMATNSSRGTKIL